MEAALLKHEKEKEDKTDTESRYSAES